MEETPYWSPEQQYQWQMLKHAYQADSVAMMLDQQQHQHRQRVQQAMLHLLQALIDEQTTLEDFNTTFQQRTHKEWNAFGMRGPSGGMFLNKLVKYIPEHELLAQQLCVSLRLPKDIQQGRRGMRAFLSFLNQAMAAGRGTQGQIQPARLPFFLSSWWHLQNPEQWPLFPMSSRRMLVGSSEADISLQDPISNYFVFRSRFLALSQELALSAWELESLLKWADQQKDGTRRKSIVPISNGEARPKDGRSRKQELSVSPVLSPQGVTHSKDEASRVQLVQERKRSHRSHLLWLLAKLGQKVGCEVWIAATNHQYRWQGEYLSDISTLAPPHMDDPAQHYILSSIDVVWFNKQTLVAAFEIIEDTTNLSVGLLHLYDLATLFHRQAIQLCVVTSQSSYRDLQPKCEYSIFQKRDLRKPASWILKETLLQHERHILRWATSPTIIKDLQLNCTPNSAVGE